MTELGAFLRDRRAALSPEDLGMSPGVSRRRVPGLRREELAQLAGISVDYYVRLEQGRTRNVSESVLDAVATALRLSDDEGAYLRNLAHHRARRRQPSKPQRVRPGLLRILETVAVPAFVLGRRMDVLAWNSAAVPVVGDLDALQARDRNIARMVFLLDGPDRYPDFEDVAKDVVSHLRADAGRHPDDPELAGLVGELSLGSDVFRRLWARHVVQEKRHGNKVIRHPAVGTITVSYETFQLPGDPEQTLVLYAAEAGSESETSLRLLTSWSHTPRPTDASRHS